MAKKKKARKSPRTRTPPPGARVRRLAAEFEAGRVAAYGSGFGPEAGVARTVRVVAEGDSWFSYFPAYDVLATLRGRVWNGWKYDVLDRAKAGALLNDMVYGRDMLDTYELLQRHRPEAFLFSGGGNDIAGQELFVMLYHHKAVQMHAGIPEINKNVLRGLVTEVFSRAYSDLIELVRIKLGNVGLPHIPILLHGYDYAIPDGRGWAGGLGPLPGPWLDPSLTRKGYDRKKDAILRRALVRELIDAFNDMQIAVAAAHPNTHHVDLRKVLPDKEWGNELHPTKKGFELVTTAIEAKLRTLV